MGGVNKKEYGGVKESTVAMVVREGGSEGQWKRARCDNISVGWLRGAGIGG